MPQPSPRKSNISVDMTFLAGMKEIFRIDLGGWIVWRKYVVNAMTIKAYCLILGAVLVAQNE